MRSKVVVLVAIGTLVFASSTVWAGPFGFGVKAGLTSFDQSWEYSSASLGTIELDSKSGVAFGVFGQIPFTPVASVRIDALFVQKGGEVEVALTSPSSPDIIGHRTVKERVDYLSLAVSGRVGTAGNFIGVYALVGPRLDFKVGGEFEFSGEFSDELYGSTVFGLVLGGGVEAGLGPKATGLLEFRYDLDLSDAVEYSGTETDLTVKNNGFLILAGVRF